ncbi:hypothetical protein [Tautonia sociabilis]|uniref:Uncharacterized protein n=1 Tax=Tautonia sociabilis TaxID=2080755 RepID=A0A432MG60_9BACT|nr:hypothetical protein [Tautonia sociabilis]RUL85557.1 hypothetical protein TsocGM_18440 [Tautonia sociabilis]
MAWYWMFLVYWLLMFVALYIISEVGQNYFYDEVTPLVGLKVGGSSLVLAAALTWMDPTIADLLTSEIWFLAMLAVAGFVLLCVVIRFHAPHALMLGPVTVVLVALMSAMAISSLEDAGRSVDRDRPIPPQQRTIRKSASRSIPPPVEEPAPGASAESNAAP